MNDFLLAVLTLPGTFSGEVEQLEGLLDSGLARLHMRKPVGVVEGLLDRLAPRWSAPLGLHGSRELAERYGIEQVHGPRNLWDGRGKASTSVHSWVELATLPVGLEYAFISPLFDSISKPDYMANTDLLERVKGSWPCLPVGLGGISAANIAEMLHCGWKGAAVLGWIWEEPGKAVSRFRELKKIIDEY